MGAEAAAVLFQAKDPQLLQLEMVRKHSLSECGEGQPCSHDGRRLLGGRTGREHFLHS